MNILKPLAFLAAFGALSACEPAGPGAGDFTIPAESQAKLQNVTPQQMVPRLSASQLTAQFDKYCGKNIGNIVATERALKADGYFLLGSLGGKGISMYVTDDNRPMIGLGQERGGPKLCMTITQAGGDYGGALDGYVKRTHGPSVQRLEDINMGGELAENIWIVAANPPIIYLTIREKDATLGELYGFAVGKE